MWSWEGVSGVGMVFGKKYSPWCALGGGFWTDSM